MSNLKLSLLVLFIFLILGISKTCAHPSWGIVVDENGCIYFADVMHNGDGTLWRIDPQTQELEAVFEKFHAHQIYINDNNDIFAGVAIWRSGEIEGEGHNYLFKYQTQRKKLDTLLFTDDWDEFHGQNFALSKDYKEIYFVMNNQLHLKPFNGKTRLLIDKTFEKINTITTDEKGNLWITDSKANNGSLYKWAPQNGLTNIAQNLMPQNPKNPIFKEKNHQLFFGIAFSHNGNPLLSENANRSIIEITKDGKTKVVYNSNLYWSPTGVYYKNKEYYIIETGYNKGHLGPRIIITDEAFKTKRILEIDFKTKKLKPTYKE